MCVTCKKTNLIIYRKEISTNIKYLASLPWEHLLKERVYHFKNRAYFKRKFSIASKIGATMKGNNLLPEKKQPLFWMWHQENFFKISSTPHHFSVTSTESLITGTVAQLVECPLTNWEVVAWITIQVIPKTLKKMVLADISLVLCIKKVELGIRFYHPGVNII